MSALSPLSTSSCFVSVLLLFAGLVFPSSRLFHYVLTACLLLMKLFIMDLPTAHPENICSLFFCVSFEFHAGSHAASCDI